eukprot:480304-Pyramimonas_sp.AAC.1
MQQQQQKQQQQQGAASAASTAAPTPTTDLDLVEIPFVQPLEDGHAYINCVQLSNDSWRKLIE